MVGRRMLQSHRQAITLKGGEWAWLETQSAAWMSTRRQRPPQRSIKARPTTSVPLAVRKPSRRSPRNTSRARRAVATNHTTRLDADADTYACHSRLPEAGAVQLLPLVVSTAVHPFQSFPVSSFFSFRCI